MFVGRKQPAKDAKPVKSILKGAKRAVVEREPTPETELEEDDDSEVEDVEDALSEAGSDGSFTISRQAAKAGLADEDEAIAALERKLGVRGSKKGMEVTDDDLDWLVTGSDSEEEGGFGMGGKRKRSGEDAEWLREKRRKASGGKTVNLSSEEDGEDGLDELVGDETENEDDALQADLEDGGFEGFESEAEDHEDEPKPQRENPYIAPVTKEVPSAGRYIPPSLRKAASTDDEALKQLQRQVKGQLNRLSDANILSILQAIEQLYESHARQHVTSTLVNLLVGLVTDPSVLNDTFIILHAAFSAALYKVIGTDFGAQLLEKLVEAWAIHRSTTSDGKQLLNLISFLSSLYNFQVIGPAILFDFIRILLTSLSEDNTELLLRIIRSSGPQLRSDDPTALKEIVLQLQRSVAETGGGEASLSVRTKFMIDTIRDLKNNRIKAGAANSALAAEHTTRLRKTLGTLNSTRALRGNEPLRVTLADIRDSEKKGKWWLIGASYHDPSKLASSSTTTSSSSTPAKSTADVDAGYESDTPGHTNLTRAARAQGMNTDIRRQIFISIVGAADYQDAYTRVQALKLKSKQMAEVSRVLVHCACVEEGWNPFYAVLAKRICQDGRKAVKGMQFAVWGKVKAIQAGMEEEEGEEREEKMGTREIVNLAKFVAFLVADGAVPISTLKVLDCGLLLPDTKPYIFSEVLLTSLFLDLRKKKGKGEAADAFETRVRVVFGGAKAAPQMVDGLLQFLGTVVKKAGLAEGKKEARAVREGVNVAGEVLRAVKDEGLLAGSEDEEEDDVGGESDFD